MTPAIPIDRRKPLPVSAKILMGALFVEGFAAMLWNAPWSVIGPAVAFLALPFAVLGVLSLLKYGVMNVALWCVRTAYIGLLDLQDEQRRTEKRLVADLVATIERHGDAA